MSINKNRKLTKGIFTIEILVAVAIITVTLTSLLGLVGFSLRAAALTKETFLANELTKGAIEAVRNIRDGDWDKMTNGNHGLTNAGGFWDFTGTEDTINGFTRTILIEDVYRDNTPGDSEATDDIETDGIIEGSDYLDFNTKKITVTVSWQEKGRSHQIEIVTYLTNWKE